MNMPSTEFSHANNGLSVGMMGADILVNALAVEGVEFVWGYLDGVVLCIYGTFYKQNKIERALVRHEQAAIHAAGGYARATGRVGVVLVTSGPGVTNTVTGIITAYLDSTPMVVIIGNMPTHTIGQDASQECDTVDITHPIVKYNFLVKGIRNLASTIKRAFYIAATGRPGPMVVDIPRDVSRELCKYGYPGTIGMRSYSPVNKGHPGQIRRTVSLLLQVERPYIYPGGGIMLAEASEELRQSAALTGYPMISTLMELDAFPDTSKQFVGMFGMHDTHETNMAMQNCDVLIAIGARFDDCVIGSPAHFTSQPRKVIRIGTDPSSISEWAKVNIPIVGSVKDVLQEVIARIRPGEAKPSKTTLAKWWGQIERQRSVDCLKYDRTFEIIKPQYVVEKVQELTRGDTFICSDVGQRQMWATQFHKLNKPRRWINSGGLDTTGVGLPHAMDIKKTFPDKEVVTITGKGSIRMCTQELLTCLQYDTLVKIYSLNNGYLGVIRQWQGIEYDNRYSHSYMQVLPDFMKLAESYGHVGMHIEKTSGVESALHEAFRLEDHIVFLDFRTNPTENVWPIVQAGKSISEVLLGVGDL